MKRGLAVFGACLLLTTSLSHLTSCNPEEKKEPEFIDYVHGSDVRLKMDYKGKSFYKDGIEKVSVYSFIDGDTTHFDPLTDTSGKTIKSRYYGIDTPESTGKIEEYGEEAKLFTKEHLKNANENGTIVVTGPFFSYQTPEFDSTGTRYLSLVWINETEKDAPYESLVLLNLYIVQEGLSYVKSLDKIPEYVDTFVKAEDQAKAFKLNLFSGEKAPLFNYGDYEAASLLDIRRALQESLKSGETCSYSGAKVRLRGTVSGFSAGMLYLTSYFDQDSGSELPEGEYAGINIYCGMSSIPSKFYKNNTYLEVAGNLSDSEEFGFQMAGCNFSSSKYNPEKDAKTNKAQVLYTPDEIPDEYKTKTFEFKAKELTEKQNDKLFCEVKITETLTCTDAYISDSDKITLYFNDSEGNKTPFRVYVPVTYRPDPVNNPNLTFKDKEDFVGHKFNLKGIFVFRKSNGKVSYQIVVRSDANTETPDLEFLG